jgi:hypothetical protein
MKQYTNYIERSWVLLKIDFEKTYDKVNWPFLQQICKMKSFDPKWCEWIKNLCNEVVWE